MRPSRFRMFWLSLLAVGLASGLCAQETRGSIYGRVLDPQTSGVPGSTVTVTNIETNTVVRLKSNDTGYYDASLLLPGNYQVTAEAGGFKTLLRKGIVVPVGTRVEVDLTLEIGTVSESVTVQADAVMLNTETGSSGQAIDNRAIMELPNMATTRFCWRNSRQACRPAARPRIWACIPTWARRTMKCTATSAAMTGRWTARPT